jgi:hypothetical protein
MTGIKNKQTEHRFMYALYREIFDVDATSVRRVVRSNSTTRTITRVHFNSLMVAKVRERLSVSKQETRKFDVESFNHRKLDELEFMTLSN